MCEDMTIEEFCELHDACKEGRDWALANCNSMADAWQKLPLDYLIWAATREGVLTEKELRLFAVSCCREIWHLITDPRSRDAVEAAEKFALGQATDTELQEAWSEACAVVRAAASAAWAASEAAAVSAAWSAATAATVAAAAAMAATGAVAQGAAGAEQAAWLRGNTRPNFKRG